MPRPDHSPVRDAMLMGRVARRYYLRDESKKDIASALGVSRFKVARLLEQARASGLVRIEIGSFGDLDVDLSTRLEEELGLERALVVLDAGPTPVAPPPELSTRHIARAAADLAGELLDDGDVLGLPWSRTIQAMIDELDALPCVEVVQLCGDQATPAPDGYASAVEVATRAARLSGGAAHVFYAPLVVDSADAAVAIRRQASVREALASVARVTTAFVGVGAWAPGLSSIYDAVGDADRAAVAREGAIGEISGVFYDAAGSVLGTSLTERLVAADGADLVAIPRVVGIASGAGKAASVAAAVRGGILQGLVVDVPLARALLDG